MGLEIRVPTCCSKLDMVPSRWMRRTDVERVWILYRRDGGGVGVFVEFDLVVASQDFRVGHHSAMASEAARTSVVALNDAGYIRKTLQRPQKMAEC